MPALLVVENVPAFFTRRVWHPVDKKPVSAANYLIAQLADDYTVFPMISDLADYGVPQSRVRSFLTLVRRDVAGLQKLEQLGRAPFPRPTHVAGISARGPISIVEALAAFGLPPLDAASIENATVDGFGGLHAVPVWSPRTYAMVAAIPPDSGASAWDNNRCPTCGDVEVGPTDFACPRCGQTLLRPVVEANDGSRRLVRGFASSYRRMHADRPAATVTTASGHIGSDYTIHPNQNRLLSTLECALLQTFPSDFQWGDALEVVGPTNVREMIGEAVPPAFTKQHGAALLGVLLNSWSVAPISVTDDRCQKGWKKLIRALRIDGRDETFLSGQPAAI